MKQTLEEAANEYMNILPVKSAIKCCDIEDLESHIKIAFKAGAEWMAKQPLAQDQIDTKLSEYINSTELDDKIKLGQYSLVSISSMAIDANSATTTLSTEFTHKDKRYEAKMVITQKEI